MIRKLYARYRALTPRNRMFLVMVVVLVVLLALDRTVFTWVGSYDESLQGELESLQAQIEKIQQKIDSQPELESKKERLGKRLSQEDVLVLPYESASEAQNMLNTCLQNLAVQSEIELSAAQSRPVQDVGEHYQKISVLARTTALTQNWTRFLYQIEALRHPSSQASGACPPLPLTIDELTVKVASNRNQPQANVQFLVSGIVRKVPENKPGETEGAK